MIFEKKNHILSTIRGFLDPTNKNRGFLNFGFGGERGGKSNWHFNKNSSKNFATFGSTMTFFS
jgi:hypothetical protein